MNPSDDQEFVKRVVNSLDADSENLDGFTQARLKAARRRAVSSLTERRWTASGSWSMGAVALSVGLVFAVWLWQQEQAPSVDALTGLEELAALDEGIELYEDLDFYLWLSEQQADG